MEKYVSLFLFLMIFLQNSLHCQPEIPNYLQGENWDICDLWMFDQNASSTITCTSCQGLKENALMINYILSPRSYVRIIKNNIYLPEENPMIFFLKANSADDIELKFIDEDGSVFGIRYSLENHYKKWNHIVIYAGETMYWWGGDTIRNNIVSFEIAVSGSGSGSLCIDEVGVGKTGLRSGLYLDPYRDSEGIGFLQRRDEEMQGEDSLVVKYLEVLQVNSSVDGYILPNDEVTDLVSTYNNSLAAMAFIIKNKKDRAENILDFYANAINEQNTDPMKQEFFINGEARGFYQQMLITDYRRGGETEDRWIGDNAWLLMAYKHYEKKYGAREDYTKVVGLILNLLKSFFVNDNECSGYVMTGWQDGDTWFDSTAHHEGNIDCYAVFKTCDENLLAEKVKCFLENKLTGYDLPFDNYTWRALAFGEPAKEILDIPEHDFRFRKLVMVNQDSVYGFYPFPDIDIDNIWTEGNGHMSCAQYYFGDVNRGYFYANEMDKMLLNYNLFGEEIKTLAYAQNTDGGFEWIIPGKGSVSSSAWYVFAKNKFNPLDINFPTSIGECEPDNNIESYFRLNQNYPNPFNPATTIRFGLPEFSRVSLIIYNCLGQEVKRIINNEELSSGYHSYNFNAADISSGVYYYKIEAGNFHEVKKMLVIK